MNKDLENLCYDYEKFKSVTNKPKPKDQQYVKNKTLWEHLRLRQEQGQCHRCDAVIALEQVFNISRARAERATWKFIRALPENYKLDWSGGVEDSYFIKEASFIIRSKRKDIKYPIKHTRYLLTLQKYHHNKDKNCVVKSYFCNLHGNRVSQVQILGEVAPITYEQALKLYNKKLKQLVKKNGNPISQI